MSFASSLAAPATIGIRSAGRLLSGGSLQSMARAVGVVLGAGVLAASYQIIYEEGRTIVFNLRANAQQRRDRNDAASAPARTRKARTHAERTAKPDGVGDCRITCVRTMRPRCSWTTAQWQS
jgi:hypothetical protein